MKKAEYKQSISDIKAIINERERFRSKFGRFNIREGLEGIWNCKTNNCIVVINRNSNLLRIRKNSVYRPALSALDGWTVVSSETLGRYADRGRRQVHSQTYLNHFIRPQIEALNKDKPEKFTIDLGPDESMWPDAMAMFNRGVDKDLRNHINQAFMAKNERKYEIDFNAVVNSTDRQPDEGWVSPRPIFEPNRLNRGVVGGLFFEPTTDEEMGQAIEFYWDSTVSVPSQQEFGACEMADEGL